VGRGGQGAIREGWTEGKVVEGDKEGEERKGWGMERIWHTPCALPKYATGRTDRVIQISILPHCHKTELTTDTVLFAFKSVLSGGMCGEVRSVSAVRY
jgi:hypothetical protein